jgi:hypothetical protein
MKLADSIGETCKRRIMKIFISLFILFTGGYILFPSPENIQMKKTFSSQHQLSYFNDKLFDDQEVLDIKLSGDLRKLFNDKNENADYHPLVLSYHGAENTEVSFPLKAKTRGHFRKTHGRLFIPAGIT